MLHSFKRKLLQPFMSRLGKAQHVIGGGAPATAFDANNWANATMWLDYGDQASVFQNTAGTTPVTADGQVIRAVTNKAANAPGDARFRAHYDWTDVKWVEDLVNGKPGLRINAIISSTYRAMYENNDPGRRLSSFMSATAGTIFVAIRPDITMQENASVFGHLATFRDEGGYMGFGCGNTGGVPLMRGEIWSGQKVSANITKTDWQVWTWRLKEGVLGVRINDGAWVNRAASGPIGAIAYKVDVLAASIIGIASGQSFSAKHHICFSDAKSDTDCDAIVASMMSELGL